MREEHVGLGSVQDQVDYVSWVFEAAFDVDAADLRDVELQVIPEGRVEVWIDSALLQVSDGVLLVRVQLQESADGIVRSKIQKVLLLLYKL